MAYYPTFPYTISALVHFLKAWTSFFLLCLSFCCLNRSTLCAECLCDPLVNSHSFEEGRWLPELSPFFPTMLADPRIIGYSVGYRSYDKIFKTPLLPVSLGDRFSIYQFDNLPIGTLFFGIEACVWAIFEGRTRSLSLVNADYYVGIPITYITPNYSIRLRLYHQSSHLGDELLMENKNIRRLNPSSEAIDLFVSYDVTGDLTLFAGIGRVIRHDETFKIKPFYLVYGFNYFMNIFKIHIANLEASPYMGLYCSNWQENEWASQLSVSFGYQWGKTYGRIMRVYLEGHTGFSCDGQFSKKKSNYLALKLLYGY